MANSMVETTAIAGSCEPSFRPYLADFDDLLINSKRVCAYGLWKDLTVAYLSPGWFEFSNANGGEPSISERWGLGSCLLTGIQEPLRASFEKTYLRCLSEQRPWEHFYECSSPECYRLFQKLTYPLRDSEGLLVFHAIQIERPHEAVDTSSVDVREMYIDDHETLHQCSYCRRVRRVQQPEVWDWVADWAEVSPRGTSHGICEGCFGFYMWRIEADLEFPQLISTTCNASAALRV